MDEEVCALSLMSTERWWVVTFTSDSFIPEKGASYAQ